MDKKPIFDDQESIIDKAVVLAERWQGEANTLIASKEKKYHKMMLSLLRSPKDKVILNNLFDQSFRSKDARRVVNQFIFQIKSRGIPSFFSFFEKFLLRILMCFGKNISSFSVSRIKNEIREKTKNTIISEDSRRLEKYLNDRRQEGVRININHLGEVVLGEKECQRRLNHYVHALKNPKIEYISIKISSICSHLHPFSHDYSLSVLEKRLSVIFEEAKNNLYIKPSGEKVSKFVNIDMEEYKYLALTVQLFMQVLDKKEFHQFSAGIVLQAYLPDAYCYQKKITEWARKRIQQGGKSVKIRVVNGALNRK